MTRQDALGAIEKAMRNTPDASNSDLIVAAGNIAGAWSHTFNPERDAETRKRLRWALVYVKACQAQG